MGTGQWKNVAFAQVFLSGRHQWGGNLESRELLLHTTQDLKIK